MARWRANPTGVGSASQLWIASEEEFIAPLEAVLALAQTQTLMDEPRSRHCDKGMELEEKKAIVARQFAIMSTAASTLTARDIFMWWTYSPAWRSRRRIWHCVVHASATARDADWW